MTHCPPSQLEEQSDQLEKLRRELEAKSGELVRVQQDLSRTEQVSCWRGGLRIGRDSVGVLFPVNWATPRCY